ncbi:MAG: hemerythrin domain-containing protein [Candidatus Manganitrophaceae bacterium]
MEQSKKDKTVDEKRGPTELLKEEHQTTLLKLDLMERSLHYLSKPSVETALDRVEVEKLLLKDLAVAIEKEIALHFRKEEGALFPVLAEYIGKEHGAIEAMLHEHEKILTTFFHWKKTLPPFCRSIEPIDEGLRKAVIDPGLKVIGLLRQHIGKEDEILFKISEASLTEREKGDLAEKLKSMDKMS